MTRSEAAKRQARRIEVRSILEQFPVQIDSSNIEACIDEIVKYGDEREAEGRASMLEEW